MADHGKPGSYGQQQEQRYAASYTPAHNETDHRETEEPSSAESSSGSISSRDLLEMRAAQAGPHAIGLAETDGQAPQVKVRRTSDPLQDRSVSQSYRNNGTPSAARDQRPPPSTRGFGSIPATAAPPPLEPGKLPGNLTPVKDSPPSPSALTSAAVPAQASEKAPASSNDTAATAAPLTSREDSSASLPGLTPTSARFPVSTPATPGLGPSAATSPVDDPFPDLSFANAGPDLSFGGQAVTSPSSPSTATQQKEARPTRFTELEQDDVKKPGTSQDKGDRPVVNVLPESVATPDGGAEGKTKGKKLVKKGGKKLVKKSRGAA